MSHLLVFLVLLGLGAFASLGSGSADQRDLELAFEAVVPTASASFFLT